MLTLRDFQEEALQEILSQFRAGITRQLVTLPTGTGKTVIFASLAKALNTRTIIIVHRDELLIQARDKILMIWPGCDTGLVKAELNEINHQVVIASVQTISRPKRLAQLQEIDFKLMIVDESHHSIADSYTGVIKGLGFMDDNPDELLLGVTATPTRLDKKGLNNVFQKVVYQRSLPTMIRAGYLSDIQAIRIKAATDLTGVHTRAGDFAPGELQAVCNTDQRNQIIVKALIKYAGERKAAVFCTGVQHAQDLAKCFQEAGVSAGVVFGDMKKEDREATLKAYAKRELQVLTNVEVLTEGWDDPGTDCIIMARPTKSQGLYTQMIGRGTRLYPGKENCLILEFTDNRHDVCNLGTLSGLPLRNKQSLKKAIIDDEERQAAAQPTSTIRKVVAKEYDLMDRSKFRWFPVGSDWRLPTGIDAYIHLHCVEPDKFTVILTEQDKTTALSSRPIPLGYAQGIAEDHARVNAKNFASKKAKWTRKPATDKQLATLDKLHIDYPEDISNGDASLLIGQEFAKRDARMKEPATLKQIYALKKGGFEVDDSLTKSQALSMFKQLNARDYIRGGI